jgi:hypothetical protein
VKDNAELQKIIDGFRTKFVNQINDYDIHTINKEYMMVWGPFWGSKMDIKKRT